MTEMGKDTVSKDTKLLEYAQSQERIVKEKSVSVVFYYESLRSG